jgi:basic membrane protein A and related proteins
MKRPTLAVAALLVAACLVATGGRATAKRQLKVGFVTFAGVVPTTRTLEGQAFAGFLRAERRLGINGRVVYVGPTQDPVRALAGLARQDYDLVISSIPFEEPPMIAARQFPRVHFLITDAPNKAGHRLKNVERTVYRAEEAGYLAGYLAALMESRTSGKHVISAVGGIRFPGVDRWIVGYRAGAIRADPGVVVRIDYSKNFGNPAKCKRVARSQIAAGSGAVFNVAGACGIGALSAAKEEGVWGVGVDIDQSYLGKHILTSAVIRIDKGVFEMVRRLVRGTFKTGGDAVFDLRGGYAGLGQINKKVPPAFLRRIDRIHDQIVAGKIKVPRA